MPSWEFPASLITALRSGLVVSAGAEATVCDMGRAW